MIATFTLNRIKVFRMVRLLGILLVFGVGVNTAFSQNQPVTANSKVVVKKGTLQSVSATSPVSETKPKSEEKLKESEAVEAKRVRPVIEITAEYIDHQISEIQKVIDKNTDNPDFNLSGYQKRIKYLESRRPEH
jgi:predicted glycoside hydrolase/deacetylase ChbG (UPF0249 family)